MQTSAGPLDSLGFTNPVLAAPMAGGPTVPALVIAAGRADSFGFLAGGYKTADLLASQIRQVRQETAAFGVNLFAPNPLPVDPASYHAYAAQLRREQEPFSLDLTTVPIREDDDGWDDKVALLAAEPVPAVSFTFGIPDRSVIRTLQRAGTVVVQTVTSVAEARRACESGVDALAVQGLEAGGHYGTLTPRASAPPVPLLDLVRQVRAATTLPLLAAGGLATPAGVKEVLAAGASAAMVGTFLLLTDESGASPTYKSALLSRRTAETVVTRAFTGRPARGIRNLFVERYDSTAPLGYPAIHYLTSPLRRAAAEAGDSERINIWAGTGHDLAPQGPAAAALAALGDGL